MKPLSRMVVALILTATTVAAQTKVTPPKNKYTPQQDVQIGREAAAEVRKEYPILNDDHIEGYLERLGDRLVEAAPRELNNPVFQYSFWEPAAGVTISLRSSSDKPRTSAAISWSAGALPWRRANSVATRPRWGKRTPSYR